MLCVRICTLHYHSLSFLLIPLLESMLPSNQEGTSLHVFNHMATGQAERDKSFFIFNVVQPTTAVNILSFGMPSTTALRNHRGFYIVESVKLSHAGRLEVQYFGPGNPNAENLGSLFTDILVIGKPNDTEWYGYCSIPDCSLDDIYTGLGWYM